MKKHRVERLHAAYMLGQVTTAEYFDKLRYILSL